MYVCIYLFIYNGYTLYRVVFIWAVLETNLSTSFNPLFRNGSCQVSHAAGLQLFTFLQSFGAPAPNAISKAFSDCKIKN